MDIFNDLLNGKLEYVEIEQLSGNDCLSALQYAKENNFKVEKIICFDSDGDYFSGVLYHTFSEDYLVDLDDWSLMAYEHLIKCFRDEAQKLNPDMMPVFEILVCRDWYDQERANMLPGIIEELRSDQSFVPKKLGVYAAPKIVDID